MTLMTGLGAPRTRSFVVVVLVGITPATILLACADDGEGRASEIPSTSGSIPSTDGGIDESDALDDADGEASAAVPCDDCAYFVDDCESGSLCPTGPFDPSTVGGAFDSRTRINVIRGRSAADVWVAGAAGSLAHFDGTSWTRSESGTQESLAALWLRSGEEATFGRLDVLHTRGIDVPDASASAGGWSTQIPTTIPAFYATSPPVVAAAWATSDAEWLWAATRQSSSFYPVAGLWRVRRSSSDGFQIADQDNGAYAYPMMDVHGTSDVLWAVGDGGLAIRITGAQEESPTYEVFNSQTWSALRGVWMAPSLDVWAVGGSGTIRHYTGSGPLWDIVEDVPTIRHLNAVWGTSSSDVWAVGEGAVVLHYDGAKWSRVKIAGLGPRRPDLYAVWSLAPGHVWIGGHGVFLSLGGTP